MKPKAAIPGGWIWLYYLDPASELLEGPFLELGSLGAWERALGRLASWAGRGLAGRGRAGAGGARARGALQRAREQEEARRRAPPSLAAAPAGRGDDLAFPCTGPAGYSLYGMVANQLGDVTSLMQMPPGSVRRPGPWLLPPTRLSACPAA